LELKKAFLFLMVKNGPVYNLPDRASINGIAGKLINTLSHVPFGKGCVTLSTLNMLPNLQNNELSAVVAKKLFLNLLEY